MTEALCFALDGVLVHRTRSDAEILRDVFTSHAIEPTEARLATARASFRRAFDALEPEPYRQSMAAVVDAADSDTDPAELVATLREETYAATTVPGAARESLSGLAETSALAVIANGPREWQVGKLDRHGLTDSFDAVVASYDAGAHRPDTAPFDRLRERVSADEYVMVGDGDDVSGARAAGFVPIEYRTDGPDLWATIDALL
ncbi:HAD family hydrolase [Haloarcula sp. S1CR25-12]|uniref:HAD family hydrolase n=1 Tax=Haloarcula saliterrae TaxID=2950534 RepID=A0ABU2FCB8_9EURY|nr:HAD family hydrolase [Haloarcula sp. S1CR25-12]MDS0259871.1 HAD family hydrolase [Haloarcula sp. S1CR25-12]